MKEINIKKTPQKPKFNTIGFFVIDLEFHNTIYLKLKITKSQ